MGNIAAVEWANSTHLGPYDPAAIHKLKDTTGGNIYISGSGTLVRALLADNLVDDLHLFVYPVALGTGKHLFTTPPNSPSNPTPPTPTASST